MNFNQDSTPQNAPPSHLQQQQYAANAARQRSRMSMLPPQFQNLSPQQLQELKNQPQFQAALRQHLQRQQMLQQQQLLQQQNLRLGQVTSAQSPSLNGSMRQGLGQGPALSQNLGLSQNMGHVQGMQQQMGSNMGSNMISSPNIDPSMTPNMASQGLPHGISQSQTMPQQMYNRNAAYMQQQQQQHRQRLQQQLQNQQSQQPQLQQAQMQQLQQAQQFQQQGHPRSASAMMQAQNAMPIGGMADPSMVPANMAQTARKLGPAYEGGNIPDQNGRNGAVPLNVSMQAAAAAAVAAAAAAAAEGGSTNGQIVDVPVGQAKKPSLAEAHKKISAEAYLAGFAPEKPVIPPQFGPDAPTKLPLAPLQSYTEWSEKLKKEGKEVPLSLKIYEESIQKDDAFLARARAQADKNKETLESMERDIKTYNTIKQLRMHAIASSAKNQYNNSIWGEGYQGYGHGVSNTATQVILPRHRKTFLKVPDMGYTDSQLNEIVLRHYEDKKPKELVPIRLDFDLERDRFKLRDTFLWDRDDRSYSLEAFVRTLIEDYKFINESHFDAIYQSVAEQIKDYKSKPEKTMGEIRVPIKIDLVINNTQFKDQFEWDILNFGENDPEEFASILCDELGLPGEFAIAVAFSIREQAQLYHKALFLVGYSFDGSVIREEEIRSHLAPPLRTVNQDTGAASEEDFVTTLRNPLTLAEYSPSMNKLTQLEIEKIDKEMERESRRRRRHFNNDNSFSYNENGPNNGVGMGRGTASRRNALHTGRIKTTLPDLSDMPKTFRTPMPSSVLPGGIDLGVPDIYGYNELIINRSQIKNPDYKPPAPAGMVTSFKDTAGSFFVKIKFRKH